MGSIYTRGIRFFKEYGVLRTIKKTIYILKKRSWRYTPLTPETLNSQRNCRFSHNIKFSIVIPMYQTPLGFFKELIASVTAQTYGNWELCLADGSEGDTPAGIYAAGLGTTDPRIRYERLANNEGISGNTNRALALAKGDFVVLCDHDDLLTPDALYHFAKFIEDDPAVDFIYSDEDMIDMKSKKHFNPHFKPDFNIDMLNCENYICHLVAVRAALAKEIRLNEKYDGAQDFDFVLRLSEHTSHIRHIPRILYHWRNHKASTSDHPESKEYAYLAGERALDDHFKRINLPASATKLPVPGCYGIEYDAVALSSISLITTKDIDGRLLEAIKSNADDIEICFANSYSTADINAAVTEASGKILFFLDPRIYAFDIGHTMKKAKADAKKPLSPPVPFLLRELYAPLLRDDISGVFAAVYDKKERVYSAGITLGVRKTYGRAFLKLIEGNIGYASRLLVDYDMIGCDLSCVMMRRKDFITAKGLDVRFDYRTSCVDLCMKLTGNSGGHHLFRASCIARIQAPLWEPGEAGHHHPTESQRRFRHKWNKLIDRGDPAYNPNLTLRNESGLPGR